jgi:Ser/Thr protein kinase RdoA (MazF antagonist)
MQTINQELAQSLIQQHWQIEGSIKELPSYADRNFKLTALQGNFVFKIANPNWSYADLDIENEALLHLAKTCPDLSLPKVMLTAKQKHIVPYTTQSGELCNLRLLSFVDGDIYANVVKRDDIDHAYLQKSLGVAIAKLDRGLSDFKHASMDRYVDWSISNLPELENEIAYIEDSVLRDLVTKHTHYFAENEAHWKATLPMSVIHNDANDFNVIVDSDATDPRPHVNAIIDFGDMCRHLRIVDLAITMVYAVQSIEKENDVRACLLAILHGYQTQHPLNTDEIKVLFHIIMARLCQSILMATRAYRKNPSNDYILVSQEGVRRLIRQLDAMDYSELQNQFLNVISEAN